jgi:DNA-binding IclR family transcriptional regulator
VAEPGESVISRVVRVLAAFRGGEPELTVAAIARDAGLPMASAHRLVGELVRWQLLERLPNRRIRVGLRLWELAVRNSPHMVLRDRALPILEGLRAATRQHTQLSVLAGTDVVYLENLSTKHSPAVTIIKVAGRLPAAFTSAGMVYAAFGPPEVREAIEAAIPPAVTVDGPRTAKDLAPVVDRCLTRGVAVVDGWVHPNVTGVAAPVRDPSGEVAAALSILVERGSPMVESTIPAVRAAAHAISRALGEETTRDPQLALLEYLVRQGTAEGHAAESRPTGAQ